MQDALSENEKKIFAQLSRTKNPPESLENRVIGHLIEQDLIRAKRRPMSTYLRWLGSVAAAVLIFVLGHWMGRQGSVTATHALPSDAYMFLLHEDDRFHLENPPDAYAEYAQWFQRSHARGVAIAGQGLNNEAVRLQPDGGIVASDEKAIDRVTGYFIIEAESLDAAIEVAKNNPHLKYGGSIEVKTIYVH